jgi:ureidoglycolate lyase
VITLAFEPLTKHAFAPFGDVIEMGQTTPLSINQGFALRFDDLANIDVSSEKGVAKVSLFEANPRPSPVAITIMERHPLGSQLFYPLQDRPWAIVVCTDPADATSFKAFHATGQQGINYARNVWHHPLLVFDEASRFVVVDRKGEGKNLEEATYFGDSSIFAGSSLHFTSSPTQFFPAIGTCS